MSTSPWEKAFLIESNVADIISRQSKHGFNFDRRRAQWYIHLLAEKIAKIDIVLVPLLPKMINIGTSYKKVFLMNGSLSKYPKLHCDNHKIPYEWIGGQFTALHYTDFDTGKVAKIKDYMLSNGWIPTEWNTKKMPLQVWQYRKRLERNGYNKFYEGLSKEDKEFYDGLLNPYLEKHFKDKPVEYMKAILTGIGFPEKDKAPTFAQIKKRLLLNPFWPSTPKITEDSLESLSTGQSQTLTLLKERMLWSHRKSFLEGLILKLREDGKIEGQANPCATPTARMKHRIAVNIPSENAVFGKECRSLFIGDMDFSRKSGYLFKPKCTDPEFIVHGTNLYFELDKKGNKIYHRNRDFIPHGRQAIVGYDGSGLELRMLCHFMIKECQDMLREAQEEGNTLKEERARRGLESALNYREVLLNGDIHTHNQHLAGLPTRAAAKSFIYAFNYGAGDSKLGSLVGGGKEEGAKIRETFLRENPCIAILIERMQEQGQKGYLYAPDGRKLYLRLDENGVPQTHKALNLLLQASGSITMKISMLFLRKDIEKNNIRCFKVLDMHDEGQFTCNINDIDILVDFMEKCVTRAGVYLNMQCPLASEAKFGSNYYETH